MMRALCAGACLALLLTGDAAFSQDFPQRPIRMVIPYPPGGAIDTVARRIVDRWTAQLGEQIVVDNRGGAGGTIGTELVAKAQPDGYTILYGNIGPLSIGPNIYEKLGYDVFADLAPVSLSASAPFILFSSTTLPVKSVQELIAYAKAHPRQLNYASSGVGSGLHLTAALFTRVAGIEAVHVPFKGIGVAIPEIAAGRIHFITYPLSGAAPHVRAGRLRPLLSGGKRRSPQLPDVPTSAEAGLPDFHSTAWHAVMAPHGTPSTVVERLQRTFASAVETPELRRIMAKDDVELVGGTPRELDAFLRAENRKWRGLIAEAGIRR